MLEVKSVTETLQIIAAQFGATPLETETIPLEAAVGRVLAVPIHAAEDVPGFNRSAVDGYAVIASDTFGASETMAAQLRIRGTVQIGQAEPLALQSGEAVYVPTGGELPQNADAMVMIEDTEDYQDGFIYIGKAAAPGNHVVFRGDDLTKGMEVIPAGVRLRPQEIGLLAALGYTVVPVQRLIRVGIISTGDEVIPIREQPVGSQVRDINSYALYAGLLQMGAQPELCGIIKDDLEQLQQGVAAALQTQDVVLISGGSSAGIRDQTAQVIASLGAPGILIHGIAVKPGKPTIIGRVGRKAVIGLPGHPGSAYMIFHLFVGYLLKRIRGEATSAVSGVDATLSSNYPSNHGREEYLPVKLVTEAGNLTARPVFGKSGMISLLTAADGYLHIPRGCEGLKRDSRVTVYLF